MARFFVNRPIVAMVISIILTIVGLASYFSLPVAQFPNIVPPEIQVKATYTGADALTIEQSVATPIEQQMSGVDNMNYMYSTNSNDGSMKLTVNFDVATDANTDQILAQMRSNQANAQLPSDVIAAGVTVQKSTSSPLIMFSLYSPKGTYDGTFLANYAYINLNDEFTRVPGIASVTVFGAGQYAMRIWVKPDTLAKLGLTIPEILSAIKTQNTVNPAGKIGAEPAPPGQEYTYAVRAQGRLQSPDEFGDVVVRANPDGSMLRVKDVARIELGAQTYSVSSRLNGQPAASIALYQLPGSNAIAAAEGAKKRMQELSEKFPNDLEYTVSLDTTLAVTEGMVEIQHTLFEALVLVIIVVFIFLQGWRATLIPLLAVPVSLIATFAFFPLFGFTVNTLSLFGLVLAIGLVVDDAIVVVEAVEHHIEQGMSPKEATLKAMEEVTGPVIAIALILAAVFVPTAFIPGITGRLYQQFAVTIAVSVLISAFNALTLSPALSALLLKPKKKSTGPLQKFFNLFNRGFGAATNGYVAACRFLIRRIVIAMVLLAVIAGAAGFFGKKVPGSFLPEEDQGYFFAQVVLPDAASLQRTDEAMKVAEKLLMDTPGVKYVTAINGYNFLSGVNVTYSGVFFVTLKEWSDRKEPSEKYGAILRHVNGALSKLPAARAFAFSPPAIPGIGTSGGVTFILQDRSGKDIAFLDEQVRKLVAAARERKELTSVSTTFAPGVPQVFMNVDREKVLKQGIELSTVYQTLQTFMGGYFVNYFNRFGRQWQVFVQAEGDYRANAEQVKQFFVRNKDGAMVPLSAITNAEFISGPEFTMRYNLYRSAQINASAAPGFSSGQAMQAMEEAFAASMPNEMGFAYLGMSFQEKQASEGVSPMAIFALSFLFVFLILAAQYESWSLPFSVLLSTPVAVFGAFAALMVGRYENNIYAQIGLVMLIGLAAKNAILIVEFAKMKHEEGLSLTEAALEGARLRLRPILMTSFAFILGCVPLAMASGAGGLSRQVMGFVVIGGMLAASFVAIFLIPVTFHLVGRLSGKKQGTTAVDKAHSGPPAHKA
ncbi:multidrug efflux RND transporter permease subunit [Roseimicrobium sp. ORNL1]|uniref:efflux RND transporter permease subunit n=1 Tax=Roseimicrobium sp. ORNL1 TaxID=2711231 RepID=UPI0013E1A86C|nr:multidrug efflux RND transporter permease subunit [Roseimicrobium sp. ORNL1]QIF00220.1 multidrug efflux RND transporter permease subunit [Roseimicrobium sp. ORNL1]